MKVWLGAEMLPRTLKEALVGPFIDRGCGGDAGTNDGTQGGEMPTTFQQVAARAEKPQRLCV